MIENTLLFNFFSFFLFRECCAAYPAHAGLSGSMTEFSVIIYDFFFSTHKLDLFSVSLLIFHCFYLLCFVLFLYLWHLSHSWRALGALGDISSV